MASAETCVETGGYTPSAHAFMRAFNYQRFARVIRYRGLCVKLVKSELKARYKNSVLGFFWSLLNPLGMMLVFTFVFTVMMPNTQDRRNFPSSSCAVTCPGNISAPA